MKIKFLIALFAMSFACAGKAESISCQVGFQKVILSEEGKARFYGFGMLGIFSTTTWNCFLDVKNAVPFFHGDYYSCKSPTTGGSTGFLLTQVGPITTMQIFNNILVPVFNAPCVVVK